MLFLPLLPLCSDDGGDAGRQSLYDMAVGQLASGPVSADEEPRRPALGDVDGRDENGTTALMRAAKEGNDWEVRMLLEAGADVNARDSEGWTALMYAVRYQNGSDIVSLLGKAGAYMRVRSAHNTTPLLLAAAYSQNPDIIDMLLQGRSGAEEEVFNAFILAVEDGKSSQPVKEEKLRRFLRKGVPVNGFFRGLTPLMYACRYGSTSLAARCLLEGGADASLQGEEGKSALDYAMENPSFPHDRIFSTLMEGKGL